MKESRPKERSGSGPRCVSGSRCRSAGRRRRLWTRGSWRFSGWRGRPRIRHLFLMLPGLLHPGVTGVQESYRAA